ncbi:Histidine phosphatase superfamily, clade-1 [Lasallia pustulata]|uniref:Histidine phosphatase superfamily, clade-1 n=1 Tax=Lasallia pustulata TaxID=136370 RepID=A0A1W5DD17_9LECA|nr:Histidine phosphatase superfamily, clade-1 [Lasallia pustulata]
MRKGYHNLSVANYQLPDPDLTLHGEEQCHHLAQHFPYHKSIELLVASPLRRTIYTTLLGFEPEIKRGLKIITLPEAQETSDNPCDTGSDVEVLKKEMADKPVDLSLVTEGWNSKKGKWADDAEAIEARAKETRKWLQARPEKEIVLVTHGGFLHYFTGDWSDSVKFEAGTGWANTEYRSYTFKDEKDDNASLVETTESRERRKGTEKPLSQTEQMELEATQNKKGENGGFQLQCKV